MTEMPEGYTVAPVELPQVRILRLQPGDKLLISSPDWLSAAEGEAIHANVKAVFPDTDVVLLARGLTLDILRKGGD